MRDNTTVTQDCSTNSNEFGCGRITTPHIQLHHSPSKIPIHGTRNTHIVSESTHYNYSMMLYSYSNCNRIAPPSSIWDCGNPYVCMLEEAKKRYSIIVTRLFT